MCRKPNLDKCNYTERFTEQPQGIRIRKANVEATRKSPCQEHGKEDRTLRENQGSTNSWKRKCRSLEEYSTMCSLSCKG